MKSASNLLLDWDDMYVFPSFIQLNSIIRLEICILPGLTFDFKYDNGVLVILDSFACVCVDTAASSSALRDDEGYQAIGIDSAPLVLMLLFPESPLWPKYLVGSPRGNAPSRTRISLRSHVNSSCLWKFYTFCLKEGGCDLVEEVNFIHSVSGYKEFNYHLFNHWAEHITWSTFWHVHYPVLVQLLQVSPGNFSAYHLIILAIGEADEPFEFLQEVLKKLRIGERLVTQALIDFFIACFWTIAEVEGGERASRLFDLPIFTFYKDSILEYS